MKIVFAVIAGVAAIGAGTASARGGEINHQANVGAALRDGCAVQQVHTPAGKLVHAAPVVRCARDTAVGGRLARSGQGDAAAGTSRAGGREVS